MCKHFKTSKITKLNYRRGIKVVNLKSWIPFFPLHRQGAGGDGWAHKSHAPQYWQCHCHSSTSTSQLQSSDSTCKHILGEILRPSTWKHNHTYACIFATRQNWPHLTFIWLCIFIRKLYTCSIVPVHWPYKWDNGIQTKGSDRPSGIVHIQISHHTFYIYNCMLRFLLFLLFIPVS